MTKCGLVAIVGRPNVGKSTLLNHILQQKLAITSRKPQTTRYNLFGIKTIKDVQAIYVDTPGLHLKEAAAINRHMNKSAKSALNDVDVVVFVVDRTRFTDEDANVLRAIKVVQKPVIVALNKVDRLEDKSLLLPHLSWLAQQLPNANLIPISALTKDNLLQLESLVHANLPKADYLFDSEQITDKSERFLAAEIIREKIIRQLGDEIPYQVAVAIEQFKVEQKITHIHAVILVERAGQKKIIIGDAGSRIKSIGTAARVDIERLLDSKVMLNLWVKVKKGWSDNERALQSLGF